jgi:hypothetical protein
MQAMPPAWGDAFNPREPTLTSAVPKAAQLRADAGTTATEI